MQTKRCITFLFSSEHFNSPMYTDCKRSACVGSSNRPTDFNSPMYTDCNFDDRITNDLRIYFNSPMYTDGKLVVLNTPEFFRSFQLADVYGWQFMLFNNDTHLLIFQLADVYGWQWAWYKSQTLSGPRASLSRASRKRPTDEEYTEVLRTIMVSCWTYFLPGFCRAVPVISTPALLSLGRSKRTRLCCYPIL